MHDVIVIGAGPAGLSAAINVRQKGGSVLVIGVSAEGNPLAKAARIDNYPGMPGVSGRELLSAFRKQAEEMGAEFSEERVLAAFYNDPVWMISAGSEVHESYAIVFTGGVNRGKPYPGEEKFLGRGVSYCATCDGMLYRDLSVVVIGFSGADREEAEYLKEIGCRVTYIEKPGKAEITGDEKMDGVIADGVAVKADGVFILRPSLAPSSLFPSLVMEGNYIKVDRNMYTGVEGLYAAGDCTGFPLQVGKAVGEGTVAGQKAADTAKSRRASGS